MAPKGRHHWVRGGLRADRERLVSTLTLPTGLVPSTVDAHRRLYGPYTAAGTVLRAIVPDALAEASDLVRAHDIEILSVSPELRALVPANRETLTSLAVPSERTRFYSRLRTLRLAHGLAELLRDRLATLGPRCLVVESVEHADPTDAELLSVLLRRLDPALLTLVICTGGRDLPGGPLASALDRYALTHDVKPSTVDSRAPVGNIGLLAAAYIAGDCVSDDPALLVGYGAVDPAERAALHDRRAAELEARGEQSLRLGAIPFHRERGADPAGAGADALRYALDSCIDMGFYDATVDLGVRGRAVIDWRAQTEHWWAFTTKMTTSLAALGRPAEAEELYIETRAISTEPIIHMQAAYATAMLYTRHHPEPLRDDRLAKAWINEAIAIASLLPDRTERTFQSAFMRNGLALIEVHLKNLPAALRLVDDGLAQLDRDLAPDEQLLHRSVLRYNRAQVYAGLGRLKDALADYDAVIECDPNYAEYYFDRGNLLRRLGRDADALADYETAMRLSPPFAEVYYNRADVRLSAGDVQGGLSDLDYVLEIDPELVDGYLNRAGVLADLGELAAARRDVEEGLALAPDNPHLRCVLGQLEAAAGRTGPATAAYDAALAADPALAAAWAGRAAVAFDAGDLDAALADLTRALDLGEDAALLFNRATALQAAGRWADALADLDRAAGLDPADPDIQEARARCRDQLTAGVSPAPPPAPSGTLER
jgi:tetratricopeptide (TPR) repeat protein